jgi:hypothetical protein
MLNLNRSNFQAHPFHLVSPSPWPLYTSISLLSLTTSAVLSFHGFAYAEYNLMMSLTSLILAMSFWWRDVIAEGILNLVPCGVEKKKEHRHVLFFFSTLLLLFFIYHDPPALICFLLPLFVALSTFFLIYDNILKKSSLLLFFILFFKKKSKQRRLRLLLLFLKKKVRQKKTKIRGPSPPRKLAVTFFLHISWYM